MSKEVRHGKDVWWLSLGLIVFFVFAMSYTTHMGITYDESHFINAALGGVTGDVIYYRFYHLPVMIMPYLSALKSYLYFPIFQYAGVNAYSVRLPAIILAGITLLIWYAAIRLLIKSRVCQLLFFILLATDPFYIGYSRFDIGPTVLQNFFIACSVYYYFQYYQKGDSSTLAIFLVMIWLGELNKLNFIWVAFAMLAGSLVVYREIWIKHIRQASTIQGSLLIIWLLSQFIIVAYLALPMMQGFAMGEWMDAGIYQRFLHLIQVYWLAFNGAYLYDVIFLRLIPYYSWVVMLELMFLSGWLSSRFWLKTNEKCPAIISFFCLTGLVEFFLMVLTPQARLPEHLMMMWPIMHLLFVYAVYDLYSRFGKRILLGGCFFGSVMIISQLVVNGFYLQAFSEPPAGLNKLYSPAVFQLGGYIRKYGGEYDAILSMDFGLNSQLLGLANDNVIRQKMHDVWFLFVEDAGIIKSRNWMYPSFDRSSDENERFLFETYFRGKKTLMIFYYPPMVSGLLDRFFDFSQAMKLRIQYLGEIEDADGQPVYVMYQSVAENQDE